MSHRRHALPPLYKTTIVIWTDWDSTNMDLAALGHEAMQGDAYCSAQTTTRVDDPHLDPEFDGTEFFGIGDLYTDPEL